MTKEKKDELYLIKDFLEEKLLTDKETDWGGYEEKMYNLAIEVIKSLIKE